MQHPGGPAEGSTFGQLDEGTQVPRVRVQHGSLCLAAGTTQNEGSAEGRQREFIDLYWLSQCIFDFSQ
jgi:hypothetical protein